MKLAVFGGTGRTGQLLVKQALDRGHEVVALARDPSRFEFTDPHLRVVEGDIESALLVRSVVADADAVIDLVSNSEGTANILEAMITHGVKRLIVTTGAGVGDPKDRPGASDRAITGLLKLLSGAAYENALRQAEIVRSSDLDWTLARVPRLTAGPATGRLRVGYLGRDVGNSLNRADLAAWILDQVTDPTHVREAPVISN